MSIMRREYDNYDSYLKHQAAKLTIGVKKKIKKFMPEYFEKNMQAFKKRIGGFQKYVKQGKILCLGARTGAEVAAFKNLGFEDSIGIDLNPGKHNKYVVKGDFHHMPFNDSDFSTVYCNCIDHAWNLKALSKETGRVLQDNGVLILEIDHLLNKNKKRRKELLKKPSKYESVLWGDFKDIEKQFEEFKLITKFVSVYEIFLVAVFEKNKKNEHE